MEKTQTQVICKNVFKSGGSTPIINQLTWQWIELINLLEKEKKTVLEKECL